MYDKVAFSFVWLIEILFWVDFENVVAHLEPNWLDFWCYFFTGFLNITERLVSFTVQFWKGGLPLLPDFLKHIWWNTQLRAARVDNGWIACFLSWFLNSWGTIGHSLPFECPCSKPIWEILESLKTFSSAHNLSGIIASEKCIWSFTHFFWCNAETDHSIINDSVVF